MDLTLMKGICELSPSEFQELYNDIAANEGPADAAAALKIRCASDLELFTLVYFPHFCENAFNKFHDDIFDETQYGERAIRRARAAPRGSAKSTLKALVKPIHDVCYGLEDYIVIIGNRQDQANGKLKDIRSEVLTNERLIADYGIRFTTRTPGEAAYTIRCGKHKVRFEAYGFRVEIRGIRFGAKRPTKIIVDDGEHSEEVNNEEIREKNEDRYFQVISKLGTASTNIEVIGTVLHREALLVKLLNNAAYDGKIYKSVISWSQREDLWKKWQDLYVNLDNSKRFEDAQAFFVENQAEMLRGTDVLWEDREPYLALMKEIVEIGRRNFMKEKQNEPMSGDDRLFDTLHWYQETSAGLLIEKSGAVVPWKELQDEAYGVIDPATGQSKAKKGKKSDFACVLAGYKDYKGRLFVHEDWTQRVGPTKQISAIFDFWERYKMERFGVETNLFRNLLLPNIVEERKRREERKKKAGEKNYGIHVKFYDIEQTDNKDKRIHTLEPRLNHGFILLNRALSGEFKAQLDTYPKVDHDDCPDALEMLWGLVNNRFSVSEIDVDAMGGR